LGPNLGVAWLLFAGPKLRGGWREARVRPRGGARISGDGAKAAARGVLQPGMSKPTNTNNPVPPADALDRTLADAADRALIDADTDAVRRRIERLRDRHRLIGQTAAFVGVAMLLGIWLLSPVLARLTNDPTLVNGRWPASISLGVIGLGYGVWWWWTTRRVARAMASGPPAMRSAEEAIARDEAQGRTILAVCGLLGGPAIIAVGIERLLAGTAWWFAVWIVLVGVWFTIDAVRRTLQSLRTDRRRKRGAS
jgi:hypothetical protein